MNFVKLAAAAALATTAIAGPAAAQEAPASVAAAGQTVYGNDGVAIGTIESVDGDTAILVVDGMKAPIPAAFVVEGELGATINTDKATIVAMIQEQRRQAAAARDAALIVGVPVMTVQGEPIGPVKSIDGDTIVLTHGDGAVTLLRNQFAIANGQLVALVAMSDIMAAMAAGAGTAPMTADDGA